MSKRAHSPLVKRVLVIAGHLQPADVPTIDFMARGIRAEDIRAHVGSAKFEAFITRVAGYVKVSRLLHDIPLTKLGSVVSKLSKDEV